MRESISLYWCEDMVCKYCGAECTDGANYCPQCAAPCGEYVCLSCKRVIPEDAKFCPFCSEKVKVEKPKAIVRLCPRCDLICDIEGATYCAGCGSKLTNRKITARLNSELNKSRNVQYCPRCYSTNIKIYRKGYDYGKATWYSLLGGGGAGRMAAGIDRNTACCRCLDCGKDWETIYDYRIIK